MQRINDLQSADVAEWLKREHPELGSPPVHLHADEWVSQHHPSVWAEYVTFFWRYENGATKTTRRR